MKLMKTGTTLMLYFLMANLIAMASPQDWQGLVTGNNVFAFKLLRQVSQGQPAANVFISPYSASLALQMAAGGAAGQTREEMQQLLGTGGLATNAVSQGNHQLMTMFGAENKNVTLNIANSMWCQKGFAIQKDFIKNTREDFGASVASLDFSDPQAASVIDKWVSDQTHGKITHLADGMLSSLTRVFLANAVYFKGKWADPFKPQSTSDKPFYLRAGRQKNIPMMNKSKEFFYSRGEDYQAVRLPYEGNHLGMYVFLPDTNSSPEKLIARLDGDIWHRTIKPGFFGHEGKLELPRFKMDFMANLNGPLQALGMKSAFDVNSADFSGIGPDLYISGVCQKTFVEVKEEGTEAAAATGIAIAAMAIRRPTEPFNMIVDRPFVFLIEDNQTGVILFMGVVFDPAAN